MPRWITSVSLLSSVRSRYLPRRPTDLMVRPSSSARKCFALGCRRTERPFETATALTFLFTTSLARSSRRVSTSGSSGTALLRAQFVQRLPRGLLLGVLLGAAAPRPALDTVHEHHRLELAVVVRPGAHDDVAGDPAAMADGELLEQALLVEVARLRRSASDAVAEQAEHEPFGCGPADIEVDGADHRLDGVGEDRGLRPATGGLLTFAEEDRRADLEPLGDLRQHPRIDHRGSHLGKLALGHVGEVAVAELGDRQSEDRVTEEFEALVRRDPALLRAPAPMGQRLLEQGP